MNDNVTVGFRCVDMPTPQVARLISKELGCLITPEALLEIAEEHFKQ